MLKAVKAVQLFWSFLLLIVFGLGYMISLGNGQEKPLSILLLTVGAVVYIAVAFLCQYNYRIAWWLAVLIPAVPLCLSLPGVLLNMWMFCTGHDLYLDSPATILIVGIYAIVLDLPALFLYFGMFIERRTIIAILFDRAQNHPPVGKAEQLVTLYGIKWILLGWALILILYYGLAFANVMIRPENEIYYTIMFFGATAYLLATIKCFSDNRVAWMAVLLLPLGPITRNVFALIHYLRIKEGIGEMDMGLGNNYDAIEAILFFVLPMLLLYYQLFHQRKELSSILLKKKSLDLQESRG
ncbi:MAG: hypothetical protein GXY07_18150 [Candidatus Hydrogenedentes bacterium]|nr:hypothetical protein [Candidatus Hydrogenedentota bacterium]